MVAGLYWLSNIVLAFIGVSLSSILLVFYIKGTAKHRSKFLFALSLFSLLFLVQYILAVLVYFELAQKYSSDVAIPLLGLNVLSLAGISAIFWLMKQ
ncbi:MAG: hypothetical protein QXX17_04840 [Conexivisphaerales archaeon]